MPHADTAESLAWREKFGVFKEEIGNGVGDPYKDPSFYVPARWKGKQMSVPVIPSGPNDSITPIPLTVPGDKYLDPDEAMKLITKRLGGKQVTEKPFRPCGDIPKSTGPGSPYGLIGPAIYDTAPGNQNPRIPGDDKLAGKRRIYTSPAKKGGFGFPIQDRTIGTDKLVYMPDEYAPGRSIDKVLKAAARARIPKPFISTGRTGRGITPVINYAGGTGSPPAAATATGGAGGGGGGSAIDKAVEKTLVKHPKAWKQSNPTNDPAPIGYMPPYTRKPADKPLPAKPFKPCGDLKQRLSMSVPNPYYYEARPPKNNDCSLF